MPVSLDLAGTKGVGRRKLDGVPEAFRTAFDPRSGADDRARAAAAESIRQAVSGEEGSFTTAGARVLAAALDLLLGGGEVGAAERLAELALDLAYGDQPVSLRPVAADPSPAARAARAVVTERLGALRAGVRAGSPEARGLSAWLLLAADQVDDTVIDALSAERDPGARAAMLASLAGHRGVDREVLRAASAPPAEPWEQAAAAAAWWALDGDAAPDDVALVLLLSRHDERPGPGFPWRAGPGRLGFRQLLATPGRGRDRACGWVARELERTFDAPPLERGAVGRAFGEVRELLAALVPPPIDVATLSPLARRVVALTTARWFLGRRDFGELGLPETVAERRAWLGLGGDPQSSDPVARVDRWADGVDGTVSGPGPTEEEARDAVAALAPERRAAWARAWLQRRRRWPEATRAPNRAPTLLALEQLDGKELDAIWCRDHEPILAALSAGDDRAVVVLARIPPGRRPSVWRAWVALHPNPAVALREGLRTAAACPAPEVACALVALAVTAGDREPLGDLARVLDAMGDAGRAARQRLAAVRAAAGD